MTKTNDIMGKAKEKERDMKKMLLDNPVQSVTELLVIVLTIVTVLCMR